MSVCFLHGDADVWNPSSSVADVFMQHVLALEQLVGLPSGLSPGNSDEIEIDSNTLRAFLGELHARLAISNHRALLSLTAPASKILCALYTTCVPNEAERPAMLPGYLDEGTDLIR